MPKPIDKEYSFGQLNNPHGAEDFPTYDSSRTIPLARLRRYVFGRNKKKVDFTDRDKFRAQVLRVDMLENDDKTNIGFFDQRSLINANLGEKVKNGATFGIYARVYLFHSTPFPITLDALNNEVFGDSESQKLIEQHVFFTALNAHAQPPAPGDIVWVNWLAKSGTLDQWREPVYLGKLDEATGAGTSALGNAVPSAARAFRGGLGPLANIGETGLDPQQMYGIKRFGAWAYSSVFTSTKTRAKVLAKAKRAKLDSISVFVNGNDNIAWKIKPSPQQIIDTVQEFKKNGIDFSLHTWIRPRQDWIDGIIDELTPLAIKAGAYSIELDIEEPWVKAKLSKEEFIEWDKKFADAWKFKWKGKITLIANAIAGAQISKMTEIMKIADKITPQMYVTNRYTRFVCKTCKNPYAKLVQIVNKRWAPVLQKKKLIIGLACYHQGGILGMSQAEAVNLGLKMAKDMGAEEVRYWVIGSLSGHKASVIAQWAGNKTGPPPAPEKAIAEAKPVPAVESTDTT